jgi:predicted nucleotidyltransferase
VKIKGLNDDGTIAREGRLELVPAGFAPVVDTARKAVTADFGLDRLHSVYLYGSIPRGTAITGRSDLDLLIALRDEPDHADSARARVIEAALDQQFPQINGAGILLFSTRALLSELERHDLGFFIACLCTPLIGDDLASQLPRYRPNSMLARETNGDLGLALPGWRLRAAETTTSMERKALCRGVARRVVRTGFTLVMPRWGGWTSDLGEAAELFGGFYPQRSEQMAVAADVARRPSASPALLRMLIDDLGVWLADENVAVHGKKALRG